MSSVLHYLLVAPATFVGAAAGHASILLCVYGAFYAGDVVLGRLLDSRPGERCGKARRAAAALLTLIAIVYVFAFAVVARDGAAVAILNPPLVND